jgi:hypothetical protein
MILGRHNELFRNQLPSGTCVTHSGRKLPSGRKQQFVIPVRNHLFPSNRLFANLPRFLSI